MTGATEAERGERYGHDLRAYHERCGVCHAPQDVIAEEPGDRHVRLCRACLAIGPCDDCGRYVGHNPDVEH